MNISNHSHNEIPSNSSDGEEHIISSIFSFTIHANITTPFETQLILKQRYTKEYDQINPRTGYKNISGREWRFDGLQSKRVDDNTIITYCSHLTSFAVLVQVKEIKISKKDEMALSIITYVGCSLSLFACLLTYAVLAAVRSVSSERIRIHKNLVLSLGIALTIFVTGINAENKTLCKIVAVSLHYFFTSVFGWMFAEGIHLYTQVVQVFSAGRNNMKIYHFLGWGIPLIFVAISVGVNMDGYGSNNKCWITTNDNMIWTFVAPVIFVIFLNICIMVRVLKILIASVNGPLEIKNDKTKKQIKAAVKGMALLLPILGLTWIFGMLAVNEETIVFQYIFSILNSCQGVLIFLLYCIGNTEVRTALRRLREKHFGSKFSSKNNSVTDNERSNNSAKKRLSLVQRDNPAISLHAKIKARLSKTVSSDLVSASPETEDKHVIMKNWRATEF